MKPKDELSVVGVERWRPRHSHQTEAEVRREVVDEPPNRTRRHATAASARGEAKVPETKNVHKRVREQQLTR